MAQRTVITADELWELGPEAHKVQAYLEGGVRVVVVVNPLRQSVALWRTPKEASLLGQGDVVALSDVVDGFRIAVDELFTDE